MPRCAIAFLPVQQPTAPILPFHAEWTRTDVVHAIRCQQGCDVQTCWGSEGKVVCRDAHADLPAGVFPNFHLKAIDHQNIM
jgi:hypothetical protein